MTDPRIDVLSDFTVDIGCPIADDSLAELAADLDAADSEGGYVRIDLNDDDLLDRLNTALNSPWEYAGDKQFGETDEAYQQRAIRAALQSEGQP